MAFLLDDGWDNCTAVARAGNAAFGVYSRCGIWVARNLTDGFIPGEIATAYGSPELARKLVDVGLWEAVEGGYLAVDYLTLNKTAEKVRAERKAESERKARWRDKKKAQEEARRSSPRGTRRGTPRGQDAGQDAGVPGFLSSPKGERSAREAPGALTEPPEAVPNPDWRRGKSFGTEPDPVEADRARRGAEAARAALSRPAAARARPGPVEAARQRGSSLDALDEVLAQVIQLRPEEVPDAEAG